jgi:hypothetical protein
VATVGICPRCVLVHDLSENGLSFLTTEPPPVGSVVPLWLPTQHGGWSHLLLVAIMHAFRHSEPLYRVGAQAIDESGAAVLRAYLTGAG